MNGVSRKALLFVALTFAISWLIALLFYLSGGRWNTPAALAVAVAYMFVPLAAAVIVQRAIYREPLAGSLGIRLRLNAWFLAAWLLPPLLALLTVGVSLLLPGVSYSPGMEGLFERLGATLPPEQLARLREQASSSPIHPLWPALAQGLIAGATVNTIAGFGEEAGWRGLLQGELARLGLLRSSLAIGLVWGVWHAPLVLMGHNYPSHPVAGVFMMIAWTVLLSPIFGYIRLKSRSVVAAALLHGTLNGTAGLALMPIRGGTDLTVGVTGAAGLVALLALNAGLWACDRFLARGRR